MKASAWDPQPFVIRCWTTWTPFHGYSGVSMSEFWDEAA